MRRRLLLEGLEARNLMAGGIGTGPGTSPIGGIGFEDTVFPRNVGAVGVDASLFIERETATGRGLNDTLTTAEFLPLGTGPGQQNTIDVRGFLAPRTSGSLAGSLIEDVDFFAVDLRGGDILDVAALGAAGRFDVLYSNGSQWFGTLQNQGALFPYPANSPLQTLGNAVGTQIVPQNGRYFIRLATTGIGSNYTLGLRVYRPAMESQPIGTQQILYLDFDGGIFPASIFGLSPIPGTTIIIPNLVDSLNNLGFNIPIVATPEAAAITNALIDDIVARVKEDFALSVPQFGGNGNFAVTGVPGQYGITILNSRDNPDPGFFAPNVTRVFVGGSGADVLVPGSGLYGISETVDIGNFDTSEFVFTILDAIGVDARTIPVSFTSSRLQIAAQGIALTISHEAGHSFGLVHTSRAGQIPSIIDANVGLVDDYDLGIDGIFGTIDDVKTPFPERDRFNEAEGYLGFQRVAASLAWALSTGRVGQPLTGRVFEDVNSDGRLTSGERSLAGITVFADANGDGILNPGEASSVTSATGTYSLAVGPSAVTVAVVTPSGFVTTTTGSGATGSGGSSNVNIGLVRVNADVTGTIFADLNGNGIRDAGEPVTPGVTVYLDLDGDDRPDLGEPRAVSAANGTYRLNFPGPGTYVIREVLPSGFEQTFPLIPNSLNPLFPPSNAPTLTPDEHVVVFNGTAITQNFNFGNRPNLDFGDAPDTYSTTLASGGPSHGLLAGLTLGTTIDRELDGQPSLNADGDDTVGEVGSAGTVVDDEDGVVVLTPIGPGANATFQVTTTNTTGSVGYLQAWFDFNRNGTFTDPGEKIVTDLTTSGTFPLTVAIPATVTPGSLFARFRYSLTRGLGIGGQAETGEVEDYRFAVQASAKLANDDTVDVTRNSQANILNVLANDFETSTNTLRITSIDRFGTPLTRGTATIAEGGRSILYTPPIGFTGRDQFSYMVTSSTGQTATATVIVNVSFLSNAPIAVDDSFDVSPVGSTPLNVLDNDIVSRSGGLTIISVTPGSQGGTTTLAGGNQAVRYTPRAGFNGTEEFFYSVTDASGQISTAKVTLSTGPSAQIDDLIHYSIDFLEPNNNTPLENVQVGDTFLVRVSVQDLRGNLDNRGVFSAFLDLLYTDDLLAVVPDAANVLGFDITFGPQFLNPSPDQNTSNGDADTPGLFNEVGSSKPFTAGPVIGEGTITLFTIRMQATAPGVAVFKANPADVPENETTLINSQAALTVAQQRLGTGELTIVSANQIFTRAIDDAFLTGVDSNGQAIRGGVPAVLNVVANDIVGPDVVIDSVTINRAPGRGSAIVGPGNNITYTADASVNDNDSFTYTILTSDGIRSTAKVDLTVGNAAANDQLDFSLRVVNADGNPITGNVAVGSRFGVQFIVDDLRSPIDASPLGVFAAFADILYNAGLVRPSNTIAGDQFDFDAVFSPIFGILDPVTGLIAGAFGIADIPGIIDEFGSFVASNDPNAIPPGSIQGDPVLVATIFFDAVAAGRVDFKTSPADGLQRESLFFQPDQMVPINRIRFGAASVTIGGGSGEASSRQNAIVPADVNDDGRVTPMDALTVINELSRSRRGEGEALSSLKRFTDVSGDGRVTALDALQVINAIAKRTRVAPPVVNVPPAVTPAISTEAYARITELQSRMAKSFESYVPAPVPLSNIGSGEGLGSDDSIEEDYLDLLARDLAIVWK